MRWRCDDVNECVYIPVRGSKQIGWRAHFKTARPVWGQRESYAVPQKSVHA